MALLVGAAAIATVGVAGAVPLAKEACDALKSEQVALTGAGLRADLARGAAWGKNNIAPDRLKKIARLIEVDEQLMFRCPAPPAETEAAAAVKAVPKAAAAKQARSAPGDAARTKVTDTKSSTGPASGGKLEPQAANGPDKPKKPTRAEAAAERKRAAAAAKAQAKIDPGDAFIPPPGAPSSTLKVPAPAPAASAQPKPQ